MVQKLIFNNGKETSFFCFFCVEYHIRIRALLQHARTIKILLILSKGFNGDTGRYSLGLITIGKTV